MLSEIRKAISYDPGTGEFHWIVKRANKQVGDIAGNVGPNGYRTIMVNYKSYYAHHLAILFTTGEMPPRDRKAHVDHINGVKTDNRIANLRVGTPSENQRNRGKINKNNTSGHRGVCRRGQAWVAQIMIDHAAYRLGVFAAFDDAVAARHAAEAKHGWNACPCRAR